VPDGAEPLLRPGLRVEVKGKFDDGEFAAKAFLMEDSPDQDAEVRGPVTKVDADRRRFWISDLEVRYEPGVGFARRSDGVDLDLAEIQEGRILDVDGAVKRPGVIEADALEWRDDKDSGSIKLEGILSDVDPADREVTLFGLTVKFEDDVDIPGFAQEAARAARPEEEELADPARFARSVEFYDLAEDPAEEHDIAAAHADVVADLARQLAAWHRARRRLAERAEAAVVDPATLKQLEDIGYVAR